MYGTIGSTTDRHIESARNTTIKIATEETVTERSKHIDVKYEIPMIAFSNNSEL